MSTTVNNKSLFDEDRLIQDLKHYLPAQAPLKDFVHHNTLHAFQHMKFEDALRTASRIFGVKVSFSISEYRELYKKHRIREDILEDRVIRRMGSEEADNWLYKLFNKDYDERIPGRIGNLYGNWKKNADLDLDAEVHTKLFKIISCYLDQGIASWKFETEGSGFLATLRDLEKNSITGFFKTSRARKLLMDENTSLKSLLDILIEDESLYEQYIFDQQFGHPGWSGMVAYIEDHPQSLYDTRQITLKEFIILDLLLEIDALDNRFGKEWQPLGKIIKERPRPLFAPVTHKEEHDVMAIWQEAFEWSYYDQVLAGIQKIKGKEKTKTEKSFQALFCIDDREGSIRRHLENTDKNCETFGTPGFFGVEFYYQPQKGKFRTKVCPAPVNPGFVIKEVSDDVEVKSDFHFSKKTFHPLYSIFYSFIGGFISGTRLFLNIFKPSLSPAASSSFSHMGKKASLIIENTDGSKTEDGLQIGFNIQQMTDRVRNVLKSIGLVENFADLVYVIGHGASSINNTHYAGYDCGACSGRPGSVNARVFSFMANHPEVRKNLKTQGIDIPESTQFVGGLHDTTRDEISFYDEDSLKEKNAAAHRKNQENFKMALDINAKERSRRFFSIDSKQSPEKIHEEIRNRSVSLFEPRPELNHATNSLCIVGRRALNEHLFLDRRAFFNSYDYHIDPDGDMLLNILNAATPVCGGINLEYYFSRTDNEKFGAGSKLPHNVAGLIGVTNGMEGDLRTGLPMQMIEVHDPLRLIMIVEQYPEIVLKTIQRNPATYNWYINEWVHLVAIHPDTKDMYVFKNGEFSEYHPLKKLMDTVTNVNYLFEMSDENFPVYMIRK